MAKSLKKFKSFKDQRRKCKPLFDIYGVHPTFYLDGEEKTMTWMGCLCTILMIGLFAWVSVFYFIDLLKD